MNILQATNAAIKASTYPGQEAGKYAVVKRDGEFILTEEEFPEDNDYMVFRGGHLLYSCSREHGEMAMMVDIIRQSYFCGVRSKNETL